MTKPSVADLTRQFWAVARMIRFGEVYDPDRIERILNRIEEIGTDRLRSRIQDLTGERDVKPPRAS